MSNLEAEVRQFIVDKFLFGDTQKIGDQDSLLEAGIVDSTGILEVIAFLEERYKIKVETDELIPENLDSIASICAFLRRKQA